MGDGRRPQRVHRRTRRRGTVLVRRREGGASACTHLVSNAGAAVMTLRKVLNSGARMSPPDWLPDNLLYETLMGSEAYGVSSDASDRDVYGICMPPKHMLFPHLAGEI